MPAHKRRPDGRLKAAVKIGVKPDGTPRYKYVFGTSERELQRKIEEVRLSVKTGTLHTSDKITVEQLLQIWMERHIAKKEPNTRSWRRPACGSCRHAFATLMISDSGCDLKTVQSLLGHADMRTTGELYTHTRDYRKQEAVNQLDALLAAQEQKRKARNRK